MDRFNPNMPYWHRAEYPLVEGPHAAGSHLPAPTPQAWGPPVAPADTAAHFAGLSADPQAQRLQNTVSGHFQVAAHQRRFTQIAALIEKAIADHKRAPQNAVQNPGGAGFSAEEQDVGRALLEMAAPGSGIQAQAVPPISADTAERVANARNQFLQTMAYRGDTAAIKVILNAGADINAQDAWGCTALHLAASQGQCDVACELINRGANLDLSTPQGLTALALAGHRHQIAVFKVLLGAGAHITPDVLVSQSQEIQSILCDPELITLNNMAYAARKHPQPAHWVGAAAPYRDQPGW